MAYPNFPEKFSKRPFLHLEIMLGWASFTNTKKFLESIF